MSHSVLTTLNHIFSTYINPFTRDPAVTQPVNNKVLELHAASMDTCDNDIFSNSPGSQIINRWDAVFHVKQSLNRLTLAVASTLSPWQLRRVSQHWLAELAKGWSGVKLPQCTAPHGAWREFNKSSAVKGETTRTSNTTHTDTHTSLSLQPH